MWIHSTVGDHRSRALSLDAFLLRQEMFEQNGELVFVGFKRQMEHFRKIQRVNCIIHWIVHGSINCNLLGNWLLGWLLHDLDRQLMTLWIELRLNLVQVDPIVSIGEDVSLLEQD